MTLLHTAKLSMDMTRVLTDIERAGIRIDTEALQNIKQEYNNRIEELLEELKVSIEQVMGDTPINLDSPEERSLLFYSRNTFSDFPSYKLFTSFSPFMVEQSSMNSV